MLLKILLYERVLVTYGIDSTGAIGSALRGPADRLWVFGSCPLASITAHTSRNYHAGIHPVHDIAALDSFSSNHFCLQYDAHHVSLEAVSF